MGIFRHISWNSFFLALLHLNNNFIGKMYLLFLNLEKKIIFKQFFKFGKKSLGKGYPMAYTLYLFSKNLVGDKTGVYLVLEKGAQSILGYKIFLIEYFFKNTEKKCNISSNF